MSTTEKSYWLTDDDLDEIERLQRVARKAMSISVFCGVGFFFKLGQMMVVSVRNPYDAAVAVALFVGFVGTFIAFTLTRSELRELLARIRKQVVR